MPEVPGYLFLRKIGEGGMGVVYLAEQLDPIRRKVALKLLRTSQFEQKAVDRFESERRFMATLHHPNIASVYAAGSTANSQPFVAMEWIDGIPITSYCDENQLSIATRLKLFQQVCDGVQHAHYRGVIHRDLKPSNILITEYNHEPVPKIIDFGVAKSRAFGSRNLANNSAQECQPGVACYQPAKAEFLLFASLQNSGRTFNQES